ncbi:MAG: FAD-binding domain-containing protein [Hyphomonas sp.]
MNRTDPDREMRNEGHSQLAPPYTPVQAPALLDWLPGRAGALERLNDFVPFAGQDYARSRNYDLGPERRVNISALSPWLSHRALLEEEVLAAVLARHTAHEADAFIREVFWRGYFKGWLEHNPDVWQRYKASLLALDAELETCRELRARYDAAIGGRSGIDCFDAWATELAETGYLHNHARMWFASIWIFTLKLPWELGADFFLRHLLDGDAASNTCSWRWVGGQHTPGKTYLARADNIDQYTLGRFERAENLAQEAIALEEPALPQPAAIRLPQTPPPGTPFALLVTEAYLSAEMLPLAQAPDVIFVLPGPISRGRWPSSHRVTEFTRALIEDSARRASAAYGVEAVRLPADRWPFALEDEAARRKLDLIVTSYLPTGQVRDHVQAGWPEGLRRQEIARRYDQLVWPHATAGFFRLKKEIPRLLDALVSSKDR